MKLRAKALIILGGMWIVISLIIYAYSTSALINDYLKLEKKQVVNDIERTRTSLNNMFSALATLNSDWAQWDDVYDFIKNQNKAFINTNFMPNTFENIKVNLMLFFDTRGKFLYGINYDLNQKKTVPIPQDLLRKDLKQIDLIIYSLASPRRVHPVTGQVFSSVLKPIGKPFTGKTIDAFRGEVKEVTIEPATDEEIANTIAVMGGEDWEMWIDYLAKEKLLADGMMTVAYSYLGPALTYSIYKHGTIGKAKEHLKMTADKLNQKLKSIHGEAMVSVDKAVVTQASAAIPVVPLYISLLFKVMKEQGIHEGCIEQIYRLFHEHLYSSHPPKRDAEGYIRLDDLEMQADVQQKIAELWPAITTESVSSLADIKGYCEDFYQLFGFNQDGINYEEEVDPVVKIASISADTVS